MILNVGMAHQRTLIREAIIAALVNAGTAAGTRVDDTRVDPWRKGELPAISVYTPTDPIEPASSSARPRELEHTLVVEIAGWVRPVPGVRLSRTMDDLALQIEAAMDLDPYLAGAAGDSTLRGTTMRVQADDGASDPIVGIVVLTYEVTYRSTVAEPVLVDFERVGVTFPVVGSIPDGEVPGSGTVPLTDLFTVEEPAP